MITRRNITLVVFILIFVIGFVYYLSSKSNDTQKMDDITAQAPSTPTPSPQVATESSQSSGTSSKTLDGGLVVEDLIVGNGDEVKTGDTVSMHYRGTLENGEKFDSSYDRNMPFETMIGVGQVIKGWDKGVPGMKIGGKRKLTIPGDLAYGPRGVPGTIPPNATLIFEVELLGIVK